MGKPEWSYFTEFTWSKGVFYLIVLSYLFLSCCVVLIELFMDHGCSESYDDIKYENPSYRDNPCRHTRYPYLLGLTPDECGYGRRLLMSVIFGSVIGWERRQADRPAGIRTMSLVSLGSCLFSICSAFAFLDGPMAWDASRVSAAIPSGVGFLGAGLIFKEAEKDKHSGETTHVVHGLTTAAAIWLSAAVGVACGGELYFAASFAIALLLTLLRFGPRMPSSDDDDSSLGDMMNVHGYPSVGLYNSTENVEPDPEKQVMINKNSTRQNSSIRKLKKRTSAAHLGGVV
jgi:uncharacterized membrane protein YhiD involved in acid resistance